jgi:chloramphenicol 3-O phosphotransferase
VAGSIILLNGTSSSGKTTLALELQRTLPSPWMFLSADAVLGGFPFDHPECKLDEVWRPLGRLFYDTVARFCDAGFDVIAEQVFQDRRQLDDAVHRLARHQVWFVGVRCDVNEAERRENARADGTPLGTARKQADLVHCDRVYDIEVDTSAIAPKQAARSVVDGLSRPPSAFTALAS